MKFGTVALVGRSNVGKSTFLNAALGQALAVVSPLPQTTRDALLGVVTHDGVQIGFLDTPGLHRQRSELGRRMNAAAREAARATDVIVFMTDTTTLERARKAPSAERALSEEDRAIIESLPEGTPAIAVINKVDRIRNKSLLLPLLAALEATGRFASLVPVSVISDDGIDRLLSEIREHLADGPPGYEEDTLTDRPTAYFVREYIREAVLLKTSGEVPHAVAVTVDRMRVGKRLTRISATIHVEKAGQRGIIVGRGGSMLTEIGTAARLRIEELLGSHVHLELFVRVTPRWKHVPRQLAELGYEDVAPERGKPKGPRKGSAS
jgi:GTP-binding protein Era